MGLDSDYDKIPPKFKDDGVKEAIVAFNKKVVGLTRLVACAYKPNLAFYLAHGTDGLEALYETVRFIRESAPDVPVILDAKFGDIGNTSAAYATFAYDKVGADAVTLNPYMGIDAATPFQRADKGIFVLCRTSNESASQLQNASVHQPHGQYRELYLNVADMVGKEWSATGHYGLVVGATAPDELSMVRRLVGDDVPILIPGIGAQGGKIEAAVKAGKNSFGNGMVINSSREIIFSENPEAAARNLNDQILSFL